MNKIVNVKKNRVNYQHVADLDGLEFLCADYFDHRYSRHVHEGTCIAVIENGTQRFYGSGEYHLAPRDSIILVNGDKVHDGHAATEGGWSYRAIYPKPEMLAKLSVELNGREGDIPWFADHVVSDPEVASKLRHFFNVLQFSDHRLERETAYLDTLTSLIRRHAKSRPTLVTLAKAPKAVSHIRDYLDDCACDNVSLDELVQMVGLSPFYLTRLFQKYVGMPPHAYQIQRRLHKAKHLIFQGVDLAETALSCGFTDQSHLNRHFKKYLGITPGAYRKVTR